MGEGCLSFAIHEPVQARMKEGEIAMATAQLSAKDQIRKLLDEQPDDSSYDELLRELAFHRMIGRVNRAGFSGAPIS